MFNRYLSSLSKLSDSYGSTILNSCFFVDYVDYDMISYLQGNGQ